jgi:hypothetical protein
MNVGIATRSAVPDYATTANLFKPPFQGLQMTARERKAALTWTLTVEEACDANPGEVNS